MIKMAVVCMTGMSASVFARQLESKATDTDVEIIGCGVNEIESMAKDIDVIILAPQVGFSVDSLKDKLPEKSAIVELKLTEFNVNESEEILNKAIAAYHGN